MATIKSIEEKARRYDEVFSAAKEWYNNPNSSSIGKSYLYAVLPELKESKESEDERIISIFREFAENYLFWGKLELTKEKALAWLEKQGKDNMGISEATKKELEDNLNKALQKETPESWNKFLDEQGEQKPDTDFSDLRTWKYVVDAVLTKENGIGNYLNSARTETIAKELQERFGKIEQKPVEVRTTGYWNVQDTEQKTTDNVKPKFHEGDWIIHQGTENIYQVVAVIDNQYQLKYGDNYTTQYCIDVDRCTRLYDVTKDAKDGDVLVNQNGEMPFIFKECKNNHIYCYCGYTNRKDIFFDGFVDSEGEELHWLNLYYEQAYPATNEQRDLLFKKMHEAGYEWNAEHKQLKKIEQSPVWSKEDDAGFADVMWAIQKARTIAKNENDMGNLWCAERFLKSLKDRYTWKPSDEHYELEEFAKIVRCNLTGISKAVQELFEAKYLQLTGNKMYGGYKD